MTMLQIREIVEMIDDFRAEMREALSVEGVGCWLQPGLEETEAAHPGKGRVQVPGTATGGMHPRGYLRPSRIG